MWPVIAGAVLAFLTKWVLDGGVRRRNLRTIREELELAEMVQGADRAAALRARAEESLDRYLKPTVWAGISRRTNLRLIGLKAVVLVGYAWALSWAVNSTVSSPDGGTQKFWWDLITGAAIGVGWFPITGQIERWAAKVPWLRPHGER